MLWLVLDYSADILYAVDLLVRARTGECAPSPRTKLGQVSRGTIGYSGRSTVVGLMLAIFEHTLEIWSPTKQSGCWYLDAQYAKSLNRG